MSETLWPFARLFSSCGLHALPVILGLGLLWGYSLRRRAPGFSGSIRRGFWVMVLFGVAVTAPLPLSLSLIAVDLLLLGLGLSFSAKCYSPAIRRYGRIQTWASLLCLVDFGILWQSGLLDQPQILDGAVAQAALTAVCFQLLLVGAGIWASVMIPLIAEMRRNAHS
jgi:hypothetical protein